MRFLLRTSLIAMLLLTALLAGACARSGEAPSAEPAAAPPAAPAPSPAARPAAGGATVGVSSHPDLGPLLVDGDGRTLYLFTRDAKDQSNCAGGCAATWPPLLTDGEPQAATGASGDLLGTITRADGSIQVTYNGWPLYHFAADQRPGDAGGQEVGGVWFVLSPAGDAVTKPAEPAPPAATQDSYGY